AVPPSPSGVNSKTCTIARPLSSLKVSPALIWLPLTAVMVPPAEASRFAVHCLLQLPHDAVLPSSHRSPPSGLLIRPSPQGGPTTIGIFLQLTHMFVHTSP